MSGKHAEKTVITAMIALVDCNSFYASCEKLFRPDLKHRPVVVLSNNDSCIVAASAEAKSAGIKRGMPLYQQKKILKEQGAAVFSSNYTLYADISRRVMGALKEHAEYVENYSIDEAFLHLPGFLSPPEALECGRYIIRKVAQDTGIPVSIGISVTKTLAKAANRLAKKSQNGFYVIDMKNREAALDATAVEDIWGIGGQYALFLHKNSIHTASDFCRADPWWIKKHLTLCGYRTFMELKGESCTAPEDPLAERKAIISSKQFGRPVTQLKEILEAAADYTTAAAEKLHRQGSAAGALTVFIATNSHREKELQHRCAKTVRFPYPVSYTPDLIKASRKAAGEIFKEGYSYIKTGIILTELAPARPAQPDFFYSEPEVKCGLSAAVNEINRRYGRNTVASLACGTGGSGAPENAWHMRQQMLSPCYTTRISDFPEVSAG